MLHIAVFPISVVSFDRFVQSHNDLSITVDQ